MLPPRSSRHQYDSLPGSDPTEPGGSGNNNSNDELHRLMDATGDSATDSVLFSRDGDASDSDDDHNRRVENTSHDDGSASHPLTEGLSHDLENQGGLRPPLARDRAVNMFHRWVPIRTTYERLNNGITTGRMQANRPGRFIGLGTDGVFRNLLAKPELDAEAHQREINPPTYEEAAADSSPEYWELTVISPIYEDEVFVDGLPVGNIANYVWNVLVLVAFQFVGFVLCYLLHTSHAAKNGARTGLGITFIMYGWKRVPLNMGSATKLPPKLIAVDPFQVNELWLGAKVATYTDSFKLILSNSTVTVGDDDDDSGGWLDIKAPYLAYGLIAFGLFIIIQALIDYYRVKLTERAILAPQQPTLTTTITEATDNADRE